jgi:hypothetical protein
VSTPPWDGGPPYAGPPYAGPPSYGPPGYGPPGYGPPVQQPWGPPAAYGPPPAAWGGPPGWPTGWPQASWRPQRLQRPGAVVAAAVLAFASAVLVLVGTLYALAFSALLSLARGPGAGIGPWTAVLHLVLAGLLVAGGVRVLAGDRRWLLGAAAVQLVLCVCWASALADVASAPFDSAVVVLPLLYAALALVAAGLTWLPDARAWAARRGSAPAGG